MWAAEVELIYFQLLNAYLNDSNVTERANEKTCFSNLTVG